jgi:hypothetical protein
MEPTASRLPRRRGSALLITMVVVVGIVALISLSSDTMFGTYRLSTLNLDRQKARFAAETVAALVESKLVELATTPNPASSELDNLSRDIHEMAADWWGLRGACYTDSSGTYREAQDGLWINGCLVRWRIEPVKVFANTLDSQGTGDGSFTVNTELDPAKRLDRATNAGPGLSTRDPGFFHFRIATEAWTLTDPRNAVAKPWNERDPDKVQVRVQAQRVVQLQLINLFQYALFHAQEDERGDIDLQTGQSLTITAGSVHSNASIYIRGGEYAGFNANPRNYHQMASGDSGHGNPGQPITLGSATALVDVVGFNGVFRLGKTANILVGVDNPSYAAYRNPFNIPVLPEATGNGDRFNLNGDDGSSTRHHINGVPFTALNDSRSPEAFQSAFGGRARDKNNGAAVVKTLANIPELGGRPYEYQQIAGDGNLLSAYGKQLYRQGTGLTLFKPNSAALPVRYNQDPDTVPIGTLIAYTDAAAATGDLIDPAGMRLYWTDTTYSKRDVDITKDTNPPPAVPLTADLDFPAGRPRTSDAVGYLLPPTALGDGFHDLEVKGYYLEKGVFGSGLSTRQYYAAIPAAIARTGLVIRERPYQTINNATGSGVSMPRPTLPAGYGAAEFLTYQNDYSTYLKSQYVVLFAGRNITEAFFNDIKNAADQPAFPEANFIVTEDEFVDSREASWMAANYGIDPQNYPSGGAGSYRMNVLTLNLRRIQDFLKNTPGSTLDPALSSALAKERFNGLIYAHRTRRGRSEHPLYGTKCKWVAPSPTVTMADRPFFPTKYAPPHGGPSGGLAATYADLVNAREGDGPLETSRCAVRVRGGLVIDGSERAERADVDWAHTGTGDRLGTSGLSIITPDRLYLWGDFNTTKHPDDTGVDQITPCAIFADGVTALSANWDDRNWQNYEPLGSNPPRTYLRSASLPSTVDVDAASTSYITSFVTNNVPNADWNVGSFGTGGSADTIHLIERWSQRDFIFHGSMVVMNEQRYSKALHYYAQSPLSNGVRVFETGHAKITFNTDLLTQDGQPPFSPWGFQVTRVVSTVNVLDN